ncbi:MAG TPA: RNA polymerase subunit sigma-24 [Rhizobium sp.]|jgi:RNA polymerase sigma-70 factor, ECF subfamily|nr:RNA polymerase subunit sigma-24 [Rhizobium sp.]
MAMALGNITPYSRVRAPDGKAVAETRQALPLQVDQPSMIHGESAIASETTVRAGLSANLAKLWRYGLVLSRQRDVADDLVQQTCVRALERAQQFADGTRLDHWLLSILHSIWLNELRSRRVRFGQGQVEAREALVFDGAEIADQKMEALQVMKRVNDLPEAQRMAVFLAYVEGFSYREVATVLDIPIGTVMSRLAAARAKLAEGEV